MSEHTFKIYVICKIFGLLKYRSGITAVKTIRLNVCAAVLSEQN